MCNSFSSHSVQLLIKDFTTGGMGGFILSVFHKLETSKKTRKLQQLPLLKKEASVYVVCVWGGGGGGGGGLMGV